jgi:hypothetical protein
MGEVDPVQFGEMVGAVKANADHVKELKDDFKGIPDLIKKGMGEIKEVIKSHMEEEEKDNDEQNKQLAELTEFMNETKRFVRIMIWIVSHWKTSLTILAAFGFISIVLLGYIFPAFTQMLYEATNGAINLTGLISYYLDIKAT